MKTLILLFLACLTLIASPVLAAEPAVTLGVDRLEGESDEAYWDRLFIQCASWTAAYGEVSQPTKEKLMELGVPPLYHLVPTWLGDGDVRHRVTLEEIIVKVGPDAAPTLLPYIADPNKHLRQRCIFVLGDFDRPEVLPALRPLLAMETDMLVLPSLIEAVGKRGAGAEGLASELAPLTTHTDERVRRASAVALGRIGDAVAIETLVTLLDDPVFSVRDPVAEAIWTLGNNYPVWHSPKAIMLNDWGTRRTPVGQWLQEELAFGLACLHTTAGSPVARMEGLLSPEAAGEGIAVLRGVLRVWQSQHAVGDLLFAALPEHFDDPRVEATRLMILTERDRLLKAEATTP